jgi:hypothetical protein
MYPLDEYFLDTPLAALAHLIMPHFPAICSAMPFGTTAVWSVDDGTLGNWLSDRVVRLIPVLSRSNPIEDYLLVEIGWDRHYIRADVSKTLKGKLQEIFPRASPGPSHPVCVQVEPVVETALSKTAKLLPKPIPQQAKKPVKWLQGG